MITIFVYVEKYCTVEVANRLNAPEDFLVQARDGANVTSEIIGTFLHLDVVRHAKDKHPRSELQDSVIQESYQQ